VFECIATTGQTQSCQGEDADDHSPTSRYVTTVVTNRLPWRRISLFSGPFSAREYGRPATHGRFSLRPGERTLEPLSRVATQGVAFA
jgi:hypothetical protein